MSSSRWLAVFAAACVLVLGLAACGGGSSSSSSSSSSSEEGETGGGGAPSAEVSGEIAGAGSTAQEAAQKAWIAEFENANSGATLSYDGVGSGGGREKFISGGVAYAGSDTPLSESEGELAEAVKRCSPGELVEVPDYISPIAIVYNLPGVEELKLEPETLAKIFNQEIENWNDPEIAKENPEAELPETRIVPVNRSDESGTTENFTDYLSKVAPKVWTHEVSGEWPVKGGEAASGTSGVIEAVERRRRRDRLRRCLAGRRTRQSADQSRQHLRRTDRRSGGQSPGPLERRSGTGEGQQKRHRLRNRPENRSERRLPDHPGLLADRLHQIQVARRSGPGEGLLRIRDQPRRAVAGRRTGRIGAALRSADQKSRSRGRVDRIGHLS